MGAYFDKALKRFATNSTKRFKVTLKNFLNRAPVLPENTGAKLTDRRIPEKTLGAATESHARLLCESALNAKLCQTASYYDPRCERTHTINAANRTWTHPLYEVKK